jgi:DNA-binding NarL/FixJ family response regulator
MPHNNRGEPGKSNPQKGKRGSNHYKAKLTEDQVYEIRKALADGEKGKDLAEDYGVSKQTISNIKTGRIWNSPYDHIEEEYIPGQGDPDA